MTCDFEMDRNLEYECCNPDYANGGVLEVREELRRKFEHEYKEIGYFEVGNFGQFRMVLK